MVVGRDATVGFEFWPAKLGTIVPQTSLTTVLSYSNTIRISFLVMVDTVFHVSESEAQSESKEQKSIIFVYASCTAWNFEATVHIMAALISASPSDEDPVPM